MIDTLGALWFGAAFVISGCALGLWQILSSPDQPNYPTSGPVKRVVMFWLAGLLLARGVEVLTATDYHATGFQIGSITLLGAFFVVMLVDHCRHWLPARTHARIRQLLTLAQCRPSPGLVEARTAAMRASTGGSSASAGVVSPALVELAMQGSRVAGPGEGPEAFS